VRRRGGREEGKEEAGCINVQMLGAVRAYLKNLA
jgi:hypothetical protein